jgi:demethylmenaquinone methyltransferase/2-methoxy-6-polyprenyl-1,4-benzoquinol methylase
VIFERIAGRYDLANTVLSLGLHRRWKRTLIGALRIGVGDLVFDAGTGTGDLADLAASRGARVIGVDLSPAMLSVAAGRFAPPRLPAAMKRRISLVRGDLLHLPLRDGTMTAVMSAFVLRHLPDLERAFHEFRRVLVPGGRVAILEFSRPRRWIRPPFDLYRHWAIPSLGGWLTGDRPAYEFLARSIPVFPEPAHIMRLIQAAEFASVRRRLLSGGIAVLYTATASGHPHGAHRTPSDHDPGGPIQLVPGTS